MSSCSFQPGVPFGASTCRFSVNGAAVFDALFSVKMHECVADCREMCNVPCAVLHQVFCIKSSYDKVLLVYDLAVCWCNCCPKVRTTYM